MTLGISRIFRSTDVGAPQLTGASGSLKAVLKGVLVDGYGAISSLGWSMPFEATNKAVFRPGKGVRAFVQIDDGIVDPLYATCRAYSTMLDVNNGTEPMPTLAYTVYIHKKYSTGAPNVPWIIIGDEAGFYLITKPYYPNQPTTALGNLWQVQYIGDYNVWDVRNKWNFHFHLSNGITTNPTSMHVHGSSTSWPQSVAMRGSDFIKGCVFIGTLPFMNNTYFGYNNTVGPNLGIVKIGGTYMCSPIHLYHTTAIGNIILGSYPGMFEPVMMDTTYTYTAATIPYEEFQDSEGTLSILLCSLHVAQVASNNTHKLIFKVGKGFRNVQ